MLAMPVLGGEYAVLTNGFRIHADRHEMAGSFVKLITKQGEMLIPASTVTEFEQEEYVPPAAPPVAPAPPPPAAAPAPAATADPKALIDVAADKAGLPRAFVHSVARAESAYRVNALSPKGAIGLMQLMPDTAKDLNADPHDPAQNAEAGARYLRELLLKYDNDAALALAAYNAGPGAVDRYKGVPPYRETVAYVDRIIRNYKKAARQ
jgi:soluble lytic murein transglycosylase-like protein